MMTLVIMKSPYNSLYNNSVYNRTIKDGHHHFHACFEAGGTGGVGGGQQLHRLDHLATSCRRGQSIQQLQATVQEADARGATHLRWYG